jgi:GNAT superfamily N-acetyltransferase
MGELQIRKLLDSELKIIVPLLHQRNPALSLELLGTRVAEMGSQGFQCVAAFSQGRLIAMAGFWIKTRYHTGKLIEPDAVFVDSEFRSHGIGDQLMKWVYDYGRTQGCLGSELHCYTSNTSAHRFWLNQGFEIIAFHFGKNL